jgi:hypothetical protein
MKLHKNKAALHVLLVLFVAGVLALGTLTLIEDSAPFAHAWRLLLNDRIMQLVMWDFLFFFVWVCFWIHDDARERSRRRVPWFLLGVIAATLMIYVYVLCGERRGIRSKE